MPWEWREPDLNECDHDNLPVSGHSIGYWHYYCSNCGAKWREICQNHEGCININGDSWDSEEIIT